MFLQPSLQFRNLILKVAVFLSIIFSSGSNKFTWYNIQYHMIRCNLMIRYSISDYQTWPHNSIFEIRISDLTAFANISRISTEDFPLVSNHLPNAKMTIVMMTEYDNVSDDFVYEQQMYSWNKSHLYTLERVFFLVVHRSLW